MRGKIWIGLGGLFVVGLIFAGVLLSSGSDQVTAFVDVNLIPMTEEIVLPGQTVLTQGDVILKIGPVDEVKVPRGAQVIDGSGKYLLPGLADMHMHTRPDWNDGEIWPVSPLDLYLANGVTIVRDFGPTGNEILHPLQWRDEIDAGTQIQQSSKGPGRVCAREL